MGENAQLGLTANIAFAGMSDPNNGNNNPPSKLMLWAIRVCIMGIMFSVIGLTLNLSRVFFSGCGAIALSMFMIVVDGVIFYIENRKQ